MNAPVFTEDLQLLNGNHAVACGVCLAEPDVAPVYPITPQTPILEKLIEFQSKGTFLAELLTPESEHSAMAAAIAASATGARVFTATSSQGLLLMHELLHYASGARTPIVLFNVNRTPAAPWGFWPDQIDSLSQRDTGWVQLYSESPQDSLDTVIQAFRIAEAVNLPVMVNHDAFYVSHSVEPVNVPDQDLVRSFLPRAPRDFRLGDGSGRSLGAPVDQTTWNLTRRELDTAMKRVEEVTRETGTVWEKLTGRQSEPLEKYRCKDAKIIFVTMGSISGTVHEAVDHLREAGLQAGLVRIRLFRPLPVHTLRNALTGVPCAIIIDRNYSPGTGGVLHQELKSALYSMKNPPHVHGFLAGVGGVNVPVERIVEMAVRYGNAETTTDPIWVE